MKITEKESKREIEIPESLPLLPLRDLVVFPHMVVPLFVGREKSIAAIEAAMSNERLILLAAQLDATTDNPSPSEIHQVGTLAEILQLLKLPDGTIKILVEGISRAKIRDYVPNDDYFEVLVLPYESEVAVGPEVKALLRTVLSHFEAYVKLNRRIPPETVMAIQSHEDPDKVADMIAAHLLIKVKERQELLETRDVRRRIERLAEIIVGEIEVLKIEKKIRTEVRSQMEQTQREYYLNEQLKAIQKELGKRDDDIAEIEELKEKIKAAGMPKAVEEKALKELRRLEKMSPMSAESTVVRTYLDWFVELPWSKRTEDKIDIAEAEKVLEEDHYGLEKPKERILEYLAVRQLSKDLRGPILCFVGPPGVGKTSLGKSVARALGRNFVRMSLGGVRDEAEIRGHRRTYVGALPGRIIQGMKKAGTINPVFLLDEIDKMSMDFRGDPSAALLEVLDPEQNKAFNDHYLEVDYDLSQVFFITTANIIHPIPRPLQDRMEIIHLSGYSESEKEKIAELFLIPKALKEHGLEKDRLRIAGQALRRVIREYTREAGVRNLERQIAKICRKSAHEFVKAKREKGIVVSVKNLPKYLGTPKYRWGQKERKDEIGVAMGLSWTETGGDVLAIEAIKMPGKGELILTGQLGDVMKESARAAMGYARSRAEEFEIPKDFYRKVDVHIHVPEGAIPKDGPSAGITMATALISVLSGIAVRNDVAMTGEITLRGKVLPIGGLKEKSLAALRAGIHEVIVPKENERDMEDIPAEVKKRMTFRFVEHMDEVLKIALARRREAPAAA